MVPQMMTSTGVPGAISGSGCDASPMSTRMVRFHLAQGRARLDQPNHLAKLDARGRTLPKPGRRLGRNLETAAPPCVLQDGYAGRGAAAAA